MGRPSARAAGIGAFPPADRFMGRASSSRTQVEVYNRRSIVSDPPTAPTVWNPTRSYSTRA